MDVLLPLRPDRHLQPGCGRVDVADAVRVRRPHGPVLHSSAGTGPGSAWSRPSGGRCGACHRRVAAPTVRHSARITSETLLITARNRPTSTGTARSAALADRRDLLQVYPESGNPASDGGSSRCTSSDHEPPSPERIRGIVGGLSGANRVVVAPGSLIPAESGEEHPSREHTTTSKSYEKGPQPDRARVGDLYRKYVEGSP